nr:TraR/DksA C4-type zinc finger protein [Rhodopseudomonas rhenobacensis]
MDEAQLLEESERTASIERVGARLAGRGSIFCQACGEEIEPARRKALPSATRCRDCQQRRENWRRMKGTR